MLASAYSGSASRRFFGGDRYALSGSALGLSQVNARLLVEKRFDRLEGRAAGGTRFALRVRVAKILKGDTARGRATVAAMMAARPLGGVIRGRSTVTATLQVRKRLTAWSVGQAQTRATLLTVKNLNAMARGFAAPDPRLTVQKILGGQVARGSGVTSATPLIKKVLAGRLIGNAAAAATVRIEKRLVARVSGLSSVSAALLTTKLLGSAGRGSAGVSSALTVRKVLGAKPMVGTGSMIGMEKIRKALVGSASGIALVTAEMESPFTARRTQSDDTRMSQTGDVRITENDLN